MSLEAVQRCSGAEQCREIMGQAECRESTLSLCRFLTLGLIEPTPVNFSHRLGCLRAITGRGVFHLAVRGLTGSCECCSQIPQLRSVHTASDMNQNHTTESTTANPTRIKEPTQDNCKIIHLIQTRQESSISFGMLPTIWFYCMVIVMVTACKQME